MNDPISGALQGVAGNLLTRLIDVFWQQRRGNEDPKPGQRVPPNNDEPSPKLFQTFHIASGFESVVAATPKPIVHILIEDQPTTAWHLAVIVVESSSTQQWYVSQKGEMAYEGTGGGLAVATEVAEVCRAGDIPVAAWICSQGLTDDLSNGQILWPTVKRELIPLSSYAKSDYFATYIRTAYDRMSADASR